MVADENLPTYQELRALLLYSAGELDTEPDFEGFAFGDTKVSGYMAAKLAIWLSRGLEEARNKPFEVGESRQYSEGTKDVGANGFKPSALRITLTLERLPQPSLQSLVNTPPSATAKAGSTNSNGLARAMVTATNES